MLSDHHLRAVVPTLQEGRQAEIVMGITGLHRGGPMPRVGAAEGGKEAPGRLNAVGEKILKIDAVVFQAIQKRRSPDLTIGLSEITAVQPFQKYNHDIGRLG